LHSLTQIVRCAVWSGLMKVVSTCTMLSGYSADVTYNLSTKF